MPQDGGDCEEVLAEFGKAGIDIDALAARLQEEGAKSFVASWHDLMDVIATKSASLGKGVPQSRRLGERRGPRGMLAPRSPNGGVFVAPASRRRFFPALARFKNAAETPAPQKNFRLTLNRMLAENLRICF